MTLASEPAWLQGHRGRAQDAVSRLGVPSTQDEGWKFTSLKALSQCHFLSQPSEAEGAASAEWDRAARDPTVVVVNNRWSTELSDIASLPAGLSLLSLRQGIEKNHSAIELHFGSGAADTADYFYAQNTSGFSDGVFIHLARDTVLTRPLTVVFIASLHGGPLVTYPRVLVVADENSQCILTVVHLSQSGADPGSEHLINSVAEVVLGENAAVEHCAVQLMSDHQFYIGQTRIIQSRNSRYKSSAAHLGGQLTRNQISAQLQGEGAQCTLNGLYLADGAHHVDTQTLIDHLKPNCTSSENYRGVLAGKSQAVFNGRVMVRPGAQKTQADQSNSNLLLSSEAVVHTKPQLEIFADDVKCTHGATVGQLDDDALFFLRARGISEKDAKSLLVRAFAATAVESIPMPWVQALVEARIVRVSG